MTWQHAYSILQLYKHFYICFSFINVQYWIFPSVFFFPIYLCCMFTAYACRNLEIWLDKNITAARPHKLIRTILSCSIIQPEKNKNKKKQNLASQNPSYHIITVISSFYIFISLTLKALLLTKSSVSMLACCHGNRNLNIIGVCCNICTEFSIFCVCFAVK